MPTITTGVTYCPQCGLPRTPDGNPCHACALAAAPPPPRRPSAPPPLPVPPAPPAPAARRSLLDLLLDPRSIHWLLGSGGVLLAAGLVIWLASLGLFENPLVVAATLAAGTLGLLAAGWSLIRLTRHQLAGRATTLLACLVMPLNLWFYQAHDLVTLDGHLWLAGVACCALYAASAWRLRDTLFVYVLNGGIAMTGLLMLADMHRFTEIAAPSTLLVVLGLIALHAPRLFPSGDQQGGDSPFARETFGLAFFRSAQALLAAGLVMLLGAQIAGHLTLPFVNLPTPQIVTDSAQRWWALALVAAGTYACAYSALVTRRAAYLYVAAATLIWGEVLAIDLLHLSTQPAALITALSLTALAANALQAFLTRRFLGNEGVANNTAITIPGAHLAALNIIPVAYGAFTYFRGSHSLFYALAMLTAGLCCRIGAHLARATSPRAAIANLYAGAAAGLIGASSLLTLAGLNTFTLQAPILMLVPIGFLVASRAYGDNALAHTFARIAQALAGALVVFTIVASTRHLLPTVFGPGTRPGGALAHALVFAEAALFYAAASVLRGRTRNVYLATASAAAALYLLLTVTAAATITYTLAFAALGLTMLVTTRLLATFRNPDGTESSPLVRAALSSANALTSLSFLSAALLTLSRLAFKAPEFAHVVQLASLAALGGLAALLAGHPGWRRGYVAAALAQLALAAVALQRLMHLSTWQNVEIFTVAAGLVLLAFGHLGWHREQTRGHRRSDAVGSQLLLGSLLAGLPLAIAALAARLGGAISLPNEFAVATVGILLLVTGNLFRIRSTTLTGGTLLALHLAMMLIFLGVRAQLALGVYLTLGGAAVFTTGLLLSIHRDRLATLPQRIKDRRGIFKVLAWR